MSVFSKYRRNMSIDWGIDTKDYPFVKCSDLPLDTKIPFFGLFIAPDSGYGENPIAILEDQLLSMPQRFTEQVKADMKGRADHAAEDACGKCHRHPFRHGYDICFNAVPPYQKPFEILFQQ